MTQKGQNFFKTPVAHPLWEKMCKHAMRRHFKKDAVIYGMGEIVTSLYYIDNGLVRMETVHPKGTEKAYWYAEKGCIVGETPFFHKQPVFLEARASKDSDIYLFSHDTLVQHVFPQHPELSWDIMRTMAQKIRILAAQIETLSLDTLEVRLCKFLYISSQRNAQGKLCVSTGLNQQELSNILGVHRVTCNRALRSLHEKGIITTYNKKMFYVLDEEQFSIFL